MWYLHDGAPAHSTMGVRRFLDGRFPDHWIGRHGPVRWPARSPDLTPMDCFIWPHIKNQVYAEEPLHNLDELWARIQEICANITPDQIQNSVRNYHRRLQLCLECDGGHFEQLL